MLARGWQGFDALVLGARGELTVRGVVERLARGMGVTPKLDITAAPKPAFLLSSARAIARGGYDPMDICALIDRFAAVLQEHVSRVKPSTRLLDSPACLIVPEGGLPPQIERLIRAQGRDVPRSYRRHRDYGPPATGFLGSVSAPLTKMSYPASACH